MSENASLLNHEDEDSDLNLAEDPIIKNNMFGLKPVSNLKEFLRVVIVIVVILVFSSLLFVLTFILIPLFFPNSLDSKIINKFKNSISQETCSSNFGN
jgi:hypothetical protein